MTEITTVEQLDEMRARVLCSVDRIAPEAASMVGMKTMRAWEVRLPAARAIREADEAAGLVTVPLDATAKMFAKKD